MFEFLMCEFLQFAYLMHIVVQRGFEQVQQQNEYLLLDHQYCIQAELRRSKAIVLTSSLKDMSWLPFSHLLEMTVLTGFVSLLTFS